MEIIKKVLKSKLWWFFIIVIIVIGGIIYNQKQRGDQIEYITDLVKRGDLVQSVSATGQVEAASATDLNFKIAGQLAALTVKVGDQVKSGQLLARLASQQAQSQVANAQAQQAEAQADLDKIIAGSSDEDLAVSQAKVNQAQADLSVKEAALDNLVSEKEQNLLSYKEQALNEIADSLFLSAESLEDINNIVNGTYESYLRNYTPTSYNLAWNSYNDADPVIKALATAADQYSTASLVSELISFLDQLKAAVEQVDSTLNSTYNLAVAANPLLDLTQATLDTYKSTITTDQTNISSAIANLQTAKANLQITSVEYDNDIKEAELNIAKAQSALEVAEAELNLVLAEPKGFDINLHQARVAMAEAKVQSALADLSEYSLFAPVSGVITQVNYELGEQVKSTEPVVSLINLSNLEIEVDIPESDIAKVKVGDEAQITLDAFGEERPFSSQIIFIDPAETVINDVVYYKVKLVFNEKDEQIKSGMTANVTINTNVRQDVLFIPQRAVISPNGESIVRVLNNGLVEEKKVTTGLKGDGGLIEILTGLSESEEIITYIKNGK
ncbi:efflux RND transporter periplasmic adaptor subunit [Patescibacteria group bacterium]|nr:efflux RND transporter periplasmic adaptor subunit [Patescibacteria group bacterium]